MENASKALIIAGAILLSILLISLGILIYNNAKGTVSEANLSEQEIQMFNEKLNSFLGKNKTSQDVKNLIETTSAIDPSGKILKLSSGSIANRKPDCTEHNPLYYSEKEILEKDYEISAWYKDGRIYKIYISPKCWQ